MPNWCALISDMKLGETHVQLVGGHFIHEIKRNQRQIGGQSFQSLAQDLLDLNKMNRNQMFLPRCNPYPPFRCALASIDANLSCIRI